MVPSTAKTRKTTQKPIAAARSRREPSPSSRRTLPILALPLPTVARGACPLPAADRVSWREEVTMELLERSEAMETLAAAVRAVDQ